MPTPATTITTQSVSGEDTTWCKLKWQSLNNNNNNNKHAVVVQVFLHLSFIQQLTAVVQVALRGAEIPMQYYLFPKTSHVKCISRFADWQWRI